VQCPEKSASALSRCADVGTDTARRMAPAKENRDISCPQLRFRSDWSASGTAPPEDVGPFHGPQHSYIGDLVSHPNAKAQQPVPLARQNTMKSRPAAPVCLK